MTPRADIARVAEGQHKCVRCDNLVLRWHQNVCDRCIADEIESHDYADEEWDPEGPEFECAGYYPEPAGDFYCPLWGSEECDWECPHGGKA